MNRRSEVNKNDANHNNLEDLRERIRIKGKLECNNDVIAIPRIGEVVIIINPKKGQERSGVIEGYCTDGKVKILIARTGKQVTRLPKNIQVIQNIS